MDLPYFSVQAKKSQEQSAMLDASDPLDRWGNERIGKFFVDYFMMIKKTTFT